MTLRYEPMLCRSFDAPFDDPAWQFSLKLDGIRALAYIERGELTLVNRAGNDVTARFPDLRAYEGYSFKRGRYVFDGEIVCERAPGVFDFQAIQTRCNRKLNIAAMAEQYPAYFYAFDILEANGSPLLSLPLRERMERLPTVYRVGGPRFNECPRTDDGEGHFFWNLWPTAEGIVAKHLDSVYEPGVRSPAWRKIKRKQRTVVLISGYTLGQGRRANGIGALLMRDPVTGERRGKVGTGLSDSNLAEISSRHFAETLYAEVEYLEKTSTGHLRLPVFIRLVKASDVEGL